MTDYYMDAAASDDLGDGTTWAIAGGANDAVKTFETLLSLMSAGDRGFVKEGTTDTAASGRTFTSPADEDDSVTIIGVKTGTTATPPTDTDMCRRGTDTLPKIYTTTNSAITFANGFVIHGIDFDIAGAAVLGVGTTATMKFFECRIDTNGSNLRPVKDQNYTKFVNCELLGNVIEITGFAGRLEVLGGVITMTSTAYIIANYAYAASLLLEGVDLSGSTSTEIFKGTSSQGLCRVVSCKLKTSYTVVDSALTLSGGVFELINSNTQTSLASASSIQDYTKEEFGGTVDSEVTVVRTGGADDQATGAFSYALTPGIDDTREGVMGLSSPPLRVWAAGGSSTTFTIYIANSGAGDYNLDDVYVEFLTPDAGDTAQHDLTIPDNPKYLLGGASTAITDDTGSTWGTGGNNHQKIAVTVTPGFTGWAMARVHFMKRFASAPEILYVDPKIAVT